LDVPDARLPAPSDVARRCELRPSGSGLRLRLVQHRPDLRLFVGRILRDVHVPGGASRRRLRVSGDAKAVRLSGLELRLFGTPGTGGHLGLLARLSGRPAPERPLHGAADLQLRKQHPLYVRRRGVVLFDGADRAARHVIPVDRRALSGRL